MQNTTRKIMELCDGIHIDPDKEKRILLKLFQIFKENENTHLYSKDEMVRKVLSVLNKELSDDN